MSYPISEKYDNVASSVTCNLHQGIYTLSNYRLYYRISSTKYDTRDFKNRYW